MFQSLIDALLGCRHKHTTRPMTPVHSSGRRGRTYVACCSCGQELAYDLDAMRIGGPLHIAPTPTKQPAVLEMDTLREL